MPDATPALLPVPAADLQIAFWARLQQVRPQYLSDALSRVIGTLDIAAVDRELKEFVGKTDLQLLAKAELRGESFFPVPLVLRSQPELLAYYRLLYGLSQKEFYKKPFAVFKRMEDKNLLSKQSEQQLAQLCRCLVETGRQLLKAIQPISPGTLHDLQMLTLGPQFRGTQNNTIGQGATRVVFDLIRELTAHKQPSSTSQVISVTNAAGRSVQIAFAPDPDITIIETMPSGSYPHTSIEIKGGTDVSNVHNRLGEAEKSHLNAKAQGFTRFWTILNADVNPRTARAESPTSQEIFILSEIRDPTHQAHRRFKELLYQSIGIN